VRKRLLSQFILVLALAGVVAPLAQATGPYEGYKSSYAQLHQLHAGAQAGYDGYKSSYPNLHLVRSHQVAVPLVQAGGRGFVWRDAAVGAATAAVAILVVAGAALFLSRRPRVAV
jgi:uncharacterized membrane protein